MSDTAEAVATETVEERPAETEEHVEAEGDDAASEDADGDGSEAAEDDGAENGSVKYSRFKNVHARMKAAESERAELQRKLDALTPKEAKAAPTTVDRLKRKLTKPPVDLPVLDQFEYYALETMNEHMPEILERWFETKFGMKPEAAGATLSHATVSTKKELREQWEQAATSRGLDPRSEQLREAVGNLMGSGKYSSFEEALSIFAPKKPPPQKDPQKIPGKGAEVDSVDLTGFSRVRAMPRTKEEAMKLASENKRIEPLSILEILRETAKP